MSRPSWAARAVARAPTSVSAISGAARSSSRRAAGTGARVRSPPRGARSGDRARTSEPRPTAAATTPEHLPAAATGCTRLGRHDDRPGSPLRAARGERRTHGPSAGCSTQRTGTSVIACTRSTSDAGSPPASTARVSSASRRSVASSPSLASRSSAAARALSMATAAWAASPVEQADLVRAEPAFLPLGGEQHPEHPAPHGQRDAEQPADRLRLGGPVGALLVHELGVGCGSPSVQRGAPARGDAADEPGRCGAGACRPGADERSPLATSMREVVAHEQRDVGQVDPQQPPGLVDDLDEQVGRVGDRRPGGRRCR